MGAPMMHLWLTLLATPMWLKLGVTLVVALCATFPAAALAFVRTEAGRALLLGVIAIAAICWFRASAFTAGRTAERAIWEGRMVAAALQVAQDTIKADRLSAEASERARRAGDDRAQNLTAGLKQAEGIAREPRAPVPAVCPEPDPSLVRLFPERDQSTDALARRLRDLRGSEGGPTAGTARKP